MAQISVQDLVFLDESGANLQMSPRYGRAYKKSRVHYAAPLNRGKRLTLISAISVRKVEAALYGEWSANGSIFLHFIEACLCPVLRKGQVVIMDNVAFHQVNGVRQAIEKAGSRLVYLPPYSPDLNPIEQMWSKLKNYLRRVSARDLDKFKVEIKTAFTNINQTDLFHWFLHCGYSFQ